MKLTAIALKGDNPNFDTVMIGADSQGNAMITPEALYLMVIQNETLVSPEYKEGDVTLSVSPADLSRMVKSVTVTQVPIDTEMGSFLEEEV